MFAGVLQSPGGKEREKKEKEEVLLHPCITHRTVCVRSIDGGPSIGGGVECHTVTVLFSTGAQGIISWHWLFLATISMVGKGKKGKEKKVYVEGSKMEKKSLVVILLWC